MSEQEHKPEEGGAVIAARRDYQHQRDRILQYLEDCKAVTDDKKAGGKLAGQDHYGSEFDTSTIERTSLAFLSVSDARMKVGSVDEQVALAELLFHFRGLMPTTPLTAALARVAERAVKEAEDGEAERAREAEAAIDGARIDPRLAIIAPIVREAQRKAEEAGERFSLKGQLDNVNKALVAALEEGKLLPRRRGDRTEYPKISEDTLRRDVEKLSKSTG